MLSLHRRSAVLALALVLPALALMSAPPIESRAAPETPALEVRQGDHISLVGGTVADRMQHDGWLETYFQSRFPKHELVFRDLGFSGDELKVRLRSANFGSPDHWLSATKADVVFAFFGYNESFAGEAGLARFKEDLEAFVKHTTTQKYSGKDKARLVLFSPIAHEDLHDRNLPDGSANNKRLALYTAAMAEVAAANNVPFVDLFRATQELYAKEKSPLTINGVHPNEHGNELLAQTIDKALFPRGPQPRREPAALEKLRQAVIDKDHCWFNRYRTVDGYNVYGGRAKLAYNGVTNEVVMQREMEVLDTMTANRDKRVWAVAQGGDLKVDDSDAPPQIPVQTNRPGTLPGGKHLFLGPEEAIAKMTVAKGMKVNVFASEKDFPELVAPVQMAWDTKGRLWVAVWPTYPHWKPGDPMNDKLLIFEDTKGTGKADKCTVFADGLHCPTGFEFYNGGVLVAQAPDLMFLKDTKGTGKADLRVRVLSGLDSADTHHTANSFTFDPGGALYFQEGTFHHSQVESPYGPPERCKNAGVFRYEPRTQKFEVYVSYAFANPHGHVFDRWGQDIVIDGTGAVPYHAVLFSGQTTDADQKHTHQIPTVYKQRTRPCPGLETLSSRHFPDELQGNLLVPNVITVQGILQYKLSDRDGSFAGTEVEPIVQSSDPNFRPSDVKIGPDGAIYFIDWHNPIIGHMQHHLRDPSRDHEHGRIYRITYENRALLKPVKIDGEPIEKLLELLKEPEDRVRYRTRIELGARDTDQVIADVEKWMERLDSKDANYEHNMLEALWVHQYHNVVNEGLLKRELRSTDFRARAAATRVLCYWRDRVKEPLQLLRTQINDAHPRVRLEAIRALSFFHTEDALAVAVELLAHPTDQYLNYTFTETLNTLERRLSSGTKLNRSNIAVSLLDILEKRKLDDDRKAALIETICRHGSDKELKAIWEKARDPKAYPPALRGRVLEWLAEAAVTRRVQPAVEVAEVQRLLADAGPALSPEVLHLAAAWQTKELAGDFQKIAQDTKAAQEVRFAAMDGLAALNDATSLKMLRELTGKPNPLAIQFHAAVALAQVDLEGAAAAAAASLAAPDQDMDPGALVQAFLVRKDGSDKLAAALDKQKIAPDTAKRILRAMFLAGRSDAALANVVGRFAGLDAAAKLPTPAEVQQLVKEVSTKGDAARGEMVFRRADLGCLKCHAVNKAGGNIGPDLGPVGAASPLDYIITSVLDPSASIKEEYLTKVITTSNGQIVTGIVVERNKNVVVLKDATGKLVRIPVSKIEEEANGKSLMPDGITRILTRAELIDLLRFVSELGKPGPYAARTPSTVQRWKQLRTVSAALREGIPNREVVREGLLGAAPEAWDTVYAQVNGTLPLAELHKPGRPEVIYLQGEVQVARAGSVEVVVDSSLPATLWIDEETYEKPARNVMTLAPGRHRITVRVVVGNETTPTLKAELRKPADSKAVFELIQMD
jgi:putative membrane-bound dehydrogenase-like protein